MKINRQQVWIAVLVTGWWVAFGLASVFQYRQMVEASGRSVTWLASIAPMASALLWIPPTFLAVYAAHRAPIGAAPWTRAIAVHLAATVAVILFRAVMVIALNDAIGWYTELPPLRAVLITSAQNNVFTYWMVTAAAHAIHYGRNARLRETQLAEATLRTLAAQLQPHFLFNALNTVATLVHENPAAAEKVIVRLSELLRQTVGVTGQEMVRLEEELGLLGSYLDIEHARFEDRLVINWSVTSDAADALVPHFILQPIVENSITHGLRPVPHPVTIDISAARRNGQVIVTVRDSGAGYDTAAAHEGFGLGSTRARLEAVFNSEYDLRIDSQPGEGTSVKLTMPYRDGSRSSGPGAA